ncbi:tRNA lysidine(34) synthetase TilS [Xanthobacter autotrophicus]|uniref:tRNA lysidine(34) synthetase TilS n=1 Tax=Xanthobacter autotrophicus TaxID=280 RepID=UPI0024A70A9D|nr:tRNA lysidine(34) synthetase TilS [Xanthobacter autotrophicus]MDI4656195.1 tRNA lysidine(34) synthetase TilS [Xanthobacter autotrophicus]
MTTGGGTAMDTGATGLQESSPVDDGDLDALFAPFTSHPCILIAISGGPDSTALLHLAARWRAGRAAGPGLIAATVDHGLRAEATREAEAVAAFAARLGVPHRILVWRGAKPAHGIQEAAREARYRLLAEAAQQAGATAIALAHTRDDQAETVLFRLARGSGLTGLCGMRGDAARHGLALLRPFLDVPKARLVATLEAAGLAFVRDPSNGDPSFARPRLRAMAQALAGEGLDARRLAVLARRVARADQALEAATDAAEAAARLPGAQERPDTISLDAFAALPDEIALRLLGRAIHRVGTEGPVELAKLEALFEALKVAGRTPSAPFRRTLAGALVSLRGAALHVAAAPPRRETSPIAPNSPVDGPVVLGKKGPRS